METESNASRTSTPIITNEWQAKPEMSAKEFKNMVIEIFVASDADSNGVLTL